MKKIQYHIACLFGLCLSYASRLFRYGAGATWPGEVALFIYPQILPLLIKRIKCGVILVAGTNGKTTTASMIKNILRHSGYSVVSNSSGANLLNGIVSSFFVQWKKNDWGVFEVDENALSKVLPSIHPQILILLNLFRDQLDRYGEVDTIARSWKSSLQTLDEATTIIANGDDPTIVAITENMRSRVLYIGLEDPHYYLSVMQHATDAIYCPKCGTRLTFGGVYFSHLGKWACGKCGFIHPDILYEASSYHSPLEGVYNIYNTIAAGAAGEVVGIDTGKIQQALDKFEPVFGRMEHVQYKDKSLRILLSKNPTGFNESLRTVLSSRHQGPMVVLLNDRTPDGKDVSWIWDVDFEQLVNYAYPIIVSGDRAFDMGVRILYGKQKKKISKINECLVTVHENVLYAINHAVKITDSNQTVWILATYSAMLDVRKILTGKKIL